MHGAGACEIVRSFGSVQHLLSIEHSHASLVRGCGRRVRCCVRRVTVFAGACRRAVGGEVACHSGNAITSHK
jgi:hypothetical protein